MRLKDSMINQPVKFHEDKTIANNLNDAKMTIKIFTPISKIIDTKWAYK